MSARNSQCICEICNCGRHRCKIHPNRPVRDGPCSLSEYTNKYTPHPMQPVASCKPAAKAAEGSGPLSDKTTHRVDYIPHPLDRPFVHHPDEYKRPEGDFDGTTMYNKEYTEKRAQKAQPVKRDVKRGVPGEFKGEPTYKSDYKQWEIPRVQRSNTNPQWEPSKDPFGGVPTYQTDYVPYQVRPPASYKPNEAAKTSGAPLEDLTDYRQSYVPHPLERKQEKERASWNRPAVPFEGLSTFTRDYTPKERALRSSMKPSAQAFASNAPFKDDTTNRVDYKPWELPRPFVHNPDEYRPPEGGMDGTTTYVKDYPAHPLVRQGYTKPADRGRPSGPFEDSTENKSNYRRWEVPQRVQAGPNQQYRPNEAPFEGQSTFNAHYVPHPIDPRRSYKPNAGAARSDGPFDGNTLYRMEYVPKHSEPCPAALLQSTTSGYKFEGIDDRGHQRYAPKGLQLGTTVTDLSNGRMVSCS